MSASSPGQRPPRVLCIAGSPRRGGNSDQLLDALARGVRDAGGEPVRLVAATTGVHTCRGCNACSQTGECVLRDAMDDVYAAFDSADALVISSPVYFATVPAVLKTIFDRCQPYWARRYVLKEPAPAVKRPGALLIVGGGGDPFGTGCAITSCRSVMNVLRAESETVLECVGPDAASDMGHYPDCLKKAEEIGAQLVSEALDRG
ncbi:MAG: flavodoxin family protein [Coriobacteriia bacterium]|nr:flavodoxin family protein [Coriobacteriia bacterium]